MLLKNTECLTALVQPIIQFSLYVQLKMTEKIHAYDSKVFLQMSAGFGRVTIPTNLREFPPVAPSPIQHRWLDKTCRELTVEEIHSIVKKFGDGAYNAKRAGLTVFKFMQFMKDTLLINSL